MDEFEVPLVSKLEHDLGETELPVIPSDGAHQIDSIKIPEKAEESIVNLAIQYKVMKRPKYAAIALNDWMKEAFKLKGTRGKKFEMFNFFIIG